MPFRLRAYQLFMKKFLSFVTRPFKWFLNSSKKVKLALIILLTIIAWAVTSNMRQSARDSYLLEKVKRSSLTEIVSESGSIITAAKINVFSPTNGIVEEILVENGDIIKKDQVLFKVISSATDQERQSAYAAYLSAKSSLNLADAQANTLRAGMYDAWEDYRSLATNSTYETDDGVPKEEARTSAEFQASKDIWSAAEKKYKDAETSIAAAKATYNAASLKYQATQNAVVKAQIPGVVENISIDKGSSVSVFTGTGEATPALVITGDKKIQATIQVGQTDILKVKNGQNVSIKPDAYSNTSFKGKVARVDEIGTTTQGVTTYTVYIDILNSNKTLLSGMTMDADITTKELDDVLTVPSSAIVLYKGGKAVRVLNEKNEVTYIPVKIGIRGENKTQVISGIDEGKEIIVSLSNEQVKRPSGFGF